MMIEGESPFPPVQDRVYCKDCSYIRRNPFDRDIVSCGYVKHLVTKTCPIKGEHIVIEELEKVAPSVRNNRYNCNYWTHCPI